MTRVKPVPTIPRDHPNATHWMYRVDKDTNQISRYPVVRETRGKATVRVKENLGSRGYREVEKEWIKNPKAYIFTSFEEALHTALSRINTKLEMLEKEMDYNRELLSTTLALEPDSVPSTPLTWKE